jgi:hypothetical protein
MFFGNLNTVRAATILGSLLVSWSASADPIYTLQFFNVDDVMSGYITNADYADQLVLQTDFLQDSGNVDISNYVTPGLNDLLVQDYNFSQGWTYGYDFQIDGVTVASGSCGTANSVGCDNNIETEDNEIVFSTDIQFTVPDPSPPPPSDVPEPSSLALLLSGMLGLGGIRNRIARPPQTGTTPNGLRPDPVE